jgi:hypothetical protein
MSRHSCANATFLAASARRSASAARFRNRATNPFQPLPLAGRIGPSANDFQKRERDYPIGDPAGARGVELQHWGAPQMWPFASRAIQITADAPAVPPRRRAPTALENTAAKVALRLAVNVLGIGGGSVTATLLGYDNTTSMRPSVGADRAASTPPNDTAPDKAVPTSRNRT